MMWGYNEGWSWLWMAAMMVLFWGGVVTLVIFAARSFNPGRREGDAAMDTLRKRLAAGDISPEDFDKTRKALQG
ncbi:MAG TPA: SHOCT domain-containing protein [Candidatus Limnocylindria bacterium]|jgi:uncharacterized membrane protein